MSYRPDELPKALKREIRQLAALAHERALGAELTALEGDFARWRRGEANPFDVADAIHRFHDGPSRRLWHSFNTHSILVLSVLAADAMAEGLLSRDEMTAEAYEYLKACQMPIR